MRLEAVIRGGGGGGLDTEIIREYSGTRYLKVEVGANI